jgi:hypothetical protein
MEASEWGPVGDEATYRVRASHARDADWCERELGDVPVRERAWFGEDVDASACVEMRD